MLPTSCRDDRSSANFVVILVLLCPEHIYCLSPACYEMTTFYSIGSGGLVKAMVTVGTLSKQAHMEFVKAV